MTELPLITELTPAPDPLQALHRVRDWNWPVLLDSASQRPQVGRYSFLTAAPIWQQELSQVEFGSDPFAQARQEWHRWLTPQLPGLPPFQGGIIGLLSYSAGGAWERLPRPAHDEFQIPELLLGLYDWVIAWDHQMNQCWLISHGWSGSTPAERLKFAQQRRDDVLQRLHAEASMQSGPATAQQLPVENLVPQFPLPGIPHVTSNFSRDKYLAAVRRAIEYIYAGDIFQVNLSQRLLSPLKDDPLELYGRLRARNPAPFAAYFEHPEFVLASASPERFVAIRDGEVETRPIKGTRRRQPLPVADLFVQDELRESAKDQSENVMIVDLLRNDLSRVCHPGSIRVPQLCTVETYETVQHLVSEVRGQLRPDATAWDLLHAAFPGGSITGAPKVRAMEIIAELEPTARGPYCGSLFYLGCNGQFDSSILIRTFTVSRGWIQFPVGGGIVAQSDPAQEYAETLHKAAGMLRALQS